MPSWHGHLADLEQRSVAQQQADLLRARLRVRAGVRVRVRATVGVGVRVTATVRVGGLG